MLNDRAAITSRITSWMAILGGLTATGVLLLHLTEVNQDRDFSPAIVLIAYSSSLAAIVVTARADGDWGVVALLASASAWRVPVRWYAVALLGPATLILIGNGVYQLAGGSPHWSAFFDLGAIGSGMGALVAGSLGEEIGWRGFAQPLLQRRFSAVHAAVIVGTIWATWHLWPTIAPGGSDHIAIADLVQTYVRLIATSIVYAWIYNSTRGSLVMVMLAHAGHNLAIDLMPPANDTVALLIAGVHLVAAGVVVRFAGADAPSDSR